MLHSEIINLVAKANKKNGWNILGIFPKFPIGSKMLGIPVPSVVDTCLYIKIII